MYKTENNYKQCPFCHMMGMRKEKIDEFGTQRTIVFKCMYCKKTMRKELNR